MSNYKATVIKTGNSYALRVPKRYVEDAKLSLGDKVSVDMPVKAAPIQNKTAIQLAIRELQKVGAYQHIKDPVAWQRQIRQDRPLPGRS